MGQDVIVDGLGAFGRGSSLSGVPQQSFFLIPTFTLLHPASFAWEETFLGISTFARHPHYPSSIQGSGRLSPTHGELISSESLGSEGLEGKAWNVARPLVLKSSPYRSWCESISCGDLSTSISPFQPPLLYETLVTFMPALTSPVSGLGRSVFALRWQLWCTRRTPQAGSPPSLGEVNSSHCGISNTVMFKWVWWK